MCYLEVYIRVEKIGYWVKRLERRKARRGACDSPSIYVAQERLKLCDLKIGVNETQLQSGMAHCVLT